MKIFLVFLLLLVTYKEDCGIIVEGVIIECQKSSFNFLEVGISVTCLPMALDFSDNNPTELTAITGDFAGKRLQEELQRP